MERKPWRCPDCGAMVAPHVDAHWCDKPDGGVTAKRPAVPGNPFTGASVTWSFPPDTVVAANTGTTYELTAPGLDTITVTPAGTGGGDSGNAVFTGENGPGVVTVSQGMTEILTRQVGDGVMSIDAARRKLGHKPWGLSVTGDAA